MIGSSVYTNLIGAVLAVILLFTVWQALPDLTPDNIGNDNTVNNVLQALNKSTVSEYSAVISVPTGGGVVVMDDGNFTYDHTSFTPDQATKYTHIKAFHMDRPASCGDGTCVCVCDNIELQDISPEEFKTMFGEKPSTTLADAEMMCENRQCAETDVPLKESQNVARIFGDKYDGYDEQAWINSFALLSINEMSGDNYINGKPVTHGGWAATLPRSEYDVTFKPVPGQRAVQIQNITTRS